ncbi:MAG TPA: ATP-binding protein [Pyrinomonadaceae bacterium]|nr:ATP-binding protein [Pyrinomonadaceae bacterium]
MRSLFLKVFLWFWLAMSLVVGVVALMSHLTRPLHEPRPPQFIEAVVGAYSQSAADAYAREGAAGLGSFQRRVEREARVRARLLDESGAELSGEGATDDERRLAAQVFGAGGTASKMFDGSVLEARAVNAAGGGGRYAFVATLPLGPPPPPRDAPPRRFPHFLPPGPLNFLLGNTAGALAARVIAALLTAGVLCYMLARYIVSPVVKLRAVTRQLTEGDLSARVGPLMGTRRDELADMGRDFDAMAARIEALLGAQARLLRDISHELRSPLARLGVALDLLRKRTPPEAETHLARIEREAARLNEMIGQLLSLSRWETGADGARAKRVDLSALVREVAEDADFEARSQNRSVEVSECDACETAGTHALLRSAFENVVRNAVRHAPEGTAVQVSLDCLKGGTNNGEAILRVRDKGPGVPEESLKEIFRPFYRVDDSRTRETGGTGLGLAITDRAVRLHAGSVSAANVHGGGFVVEIRLPLVSPDID